MRGLQRGLQAGNCAGLEQHVPRKLFERVPLFPFREDEGLTYITLLLETMQTLLYQGTCMHPYTHTLPHTLTHTQHIYSYTRHKLMRFCLDLTIMLKKWKKDQLPITFTVVRFIDVSNQSFVKTLSQDVLRWRSLT